MGKGVSDIVNVKHLTNPVKFTQDVIKTAKKSPLQAATMTGMPGMGRGLMPDVINQRVESAIRKRPYKYERNEYYDTQSQVFPMANPTEIPLPPAPEAPTPEAPLAQRGRSFYDAAREAKIKASKRKGILSTILAGGGEQSSSNQLGGGSSLLG